MPLPSPRPMRLRRWVEPGFGFRLWRPISSARESLSFGAISRSPRPGARRRAADPAAAASPHAPPTCRSDPGPTPSASLSASGWCRSATWSAKSSPPSGSTLLGGSLRRGLLGRDRDRSLARRRLGLATVRLDRLQVLAVLRRLAGQTEDLGDGETTQLGDLLRPPQADQAVHRRLHQVDRVLRADRLGQHVTDPTELEHGTDAAAGDHAGTGTGRAQHHMAGAVAADDPVGDRLAVFGHADQVLAGVLDALLDRQRHLARLAVADPDHAFLVADGDQRGEGEAATALDHLGDAIDLDHALLEVEAARADRLDVVHVHALHEQRTTVAEVRPGRAIRTAALPRARPRPAP